MGVDRDAYETRLIGAAATGAAEASSASDSPLLPTADAVGGVLDYYQWQAILRAVSR